jgi:hypothetical protein
VRKLERVRRKIKATDRGDSPSSEEDALEEFGHEGKIKIERKSQPSSSNSSGAEEDAGAARGTMEVGPEGTVVSEEVIEEVAV